MRVRTLARPLLTAKTTSARPRLAYARADRARRRWGCRRTAGPRNGPHGAGRASSSAARIRGPERIDADRRPNRRADQPHDTQRHRVTTDPAGGFTSRCEPGDYRVELTLREGEAIVRQPGVIHVNRSDVDADADFVIGNGRVSRPRPGLQGGRRAGVASRLTATGKSQVPSSNQSPTHSQIPIPNPRLPISLRIWTWLLVGSWDLGVPWDLGFGDLGLVTIIP